ncbi:ribonuclease R [Sedimentisphaera salicampi]|uniref:ribonuclease R n=1 Tax=Sedimentisphaera salicampi TaxID=1941349 RepID=UPI000B9A686F|nr:ribonuclease R [Sedimentisphaera salicampi]OXU14520.1 Ribonuclease R [Sedimentisphaera salicampi]
MKSLKNRILKFVKNSEYSPVTEKELAEMLGADDKQQREQFSETVRKMLEEGLLDLGKNSRITLPSSGDVVKGTFRSTRQEFGFVSPLIATRDGDLRIERHNINGACDGDTVEAKVIRRRRKGKKFLLAGKITKVIERAKTTSTGTLYKNEGRWMIVPDGNFFKAPFFVDDPKIKGAKQEDKVYYEVLKYPKDKNFGKAVIIEVIGRAGLYETEIEATVKNFELRSGFDEKCRNQARKCADVDFKPGKGYEDIRSKELITIDPDTAKDYDDAISLEFDEENNPVLGIHIADVSRFVTEGSALDEEAGLRGNSVYLPGRVLPMLPEVLSNGVCSLQPHQPRFAKSVYITYDKRGRVVKNKTKYANSLIQSSARLTYRDADRMLQGEKLDFPQEINKLLRDMDMLARRIEKRREEDGMIHLDLPDIDLVLNDDGEVVDANPADQSYPHTIIEMFMVEANEAVARLLESFDIPFIRRIHPDPDAFSAQRLADFVSVCGMKMPPSADRESLRKILDKVRGTGLEYAVNNAVLRSLQKAVYSPENIGHYALASRHYTHFTSPIRRYADLTIHRLLDKYLKEGRLSEKMEIPSEQDLVQLGTHISETEDKAENAERDLKKVLVLQMLEKKVGETLECYVCGVVRKGIFVQCKKFGIEGFIPSEQLGPDRWEFHEKSQTLTGQHSGVRVRIGLEIDVTISNVVVPIRQITLLPNEPLVKKTELKPKHEKKHKFKAKTKDRRSYTQSRKRRKSKRKSK